MSEDKEVHGIVEQDYNQWKHHPVTKVLHQYLRDFREALRRDHVARWEAGQLDQNVESEARGRCAAVTEIEGLEFAHIEQFYEEDNAAEVDSDNSRPVRAG